MSRKFQIKNRYSRKSADKAKDFTIAKIIMLGDAAVGKTSLVQRFVHKAFKRSYKATLGLDLSFYDVEVEENNIVRLQIWDVAGQRAFKRMRERFYEGTAGAVLVYDITRPPTFQNLPLWLNELNNITGSIPFAVVGNKLDLVEMISTEEAEEIKWAEENKAVAFFRTSALSGKNVDEVFTILAIKTLEILTQQAQELLVKDKDR